MTCRITTVTKTLLPRSKPYTTSGTNRSSLANSAWPRIPWPPVNPGVIIMPVTPQAMIKSSPIGLTPSTRSSLNMTGGKVIPFLRLTIPIQCTILTAIRQAPRSKTNRSKKPRPTKPRNPKPKTFRRPIRGHAPKSPARFASLIPALKRFKPSTKSSSSTALRPRTSAPGPSPMVPGR